MYKEISWRVTEEERKNNLHFWDRLIMQVLFEVEKNYF